MADCKTMMVRRNSRDMIGTCGSRSSGNTSHPQAPPPHHHHHHHSNSSRSKSYYHNHVHQHRYHNQCQYYNPTGPPFCSSSFQNGYGYLSPSSSPPHPSTMSEPHQQQFLGHNENSFTGNGRQHTPRYQQLQQDPPPRPWIQLAHHKHKRTCFTVLCYNILCSRYATHAMYSYCPSWALDWNYRRKAILQELVHYAPDIISLQEMERGQFYNYFLPQLQLVGYSGIFAAKSRARTMIESKRKSVDDNIALAALFETKQDSEQAKGLHGLVTPRPRPLLVCTCHIHWDPNYCDVKLVQTMMLMQELKKITEGIEIEETPISGAPSGTRQNIKGHSHNTRSGSSSSSGSCSTSYSFSSSQQTNSIDKVNLLVCGDFNSLPQSGVVEFMQSGSISSSHQDFKGLNYEGYIESGSRNDEINDESRRCERKSSKTEKATNSNLLKSSSQEFQHDFNLRSVYSACTMPFTNYTLDFQGAIDYIFHSVKGLRPLGILGPLEDSWLIQHNMVGAPHPCIPSDHLPLLVELEMIPAI